MITVLDVEILTWNTVAVLAALAWCVAAVRLLPRSWRDSDEGFVALPALLATANLAAILLLDDLHRPQGDLWEQQPITSGAMAGQAMLGVAVVVLELVLALLAALSLASVVTGIRTWLGASDADGPWKGITNGTRTRRRWWSWYYQKRLTQQIRAYARVQGGRSRTVAVERVFEAGEASTTLRIQPLLSVPLSLDKQVFPALRWSSRIQHNSTGSGTVLEVHWDPAAVDRGPARRRPLVPTRWNRQVAAAAGLAVVLAVALVASTSWDTTESEPAGSAATLQRGLQYAVNLPRGADPGITVQNGPDLPGASPAWAVDEVDLPAPSHTDLCRPFERGAAAGARCEAVTTFTPDYPITITAVAVDAYGVIADRAVRTIAWEFDGIPAPFEGGAAIRVIQAVGPGHLWQTLPLRSPITATKVTATVLDAVQAGPLANSFTDQSIVAAGSYRLIGIREPREPRSAPTAGTELAPTH